MAVVPMSHLDYPQIKDDDLSVLLTSLQCSTAPSGIPIPDMKDIVSLKDYKQLDYIDNNFILCNLSNDTPMNDRLHIATSVPQYLNKILLHTGGVFV